MKKTLLLIILTALVCFTACGKDAETSSAENVLADADIEYTPAEEFDYYEENGEIVIDRYMGEAKIVKIPETIDGKPVTALDNCVFQNNDIVERIILPDSLKRIDDNVFMNCWSLEIISGGNNLESIGYMGCAANKVKSMNLPDTLHTIGYCAFSMTDLEEVTIPPRMTEISDGAFINTNIETLIIPFHIKEVGDQAFDSCKNLKTVVIEEGVEVLGDSVFGNCDSLTSIILPSTLTEETNIDAFWGAGSVENKCTIYVPENCVLKDAILELYNDGYDWCCAEVIPAPPGTESSQPEEENTPETDTQPVEETIPETEEPLVETKEYMGYIYWEENGTITIEGYTGDDSALDIPAEIDGKPVVEIGMNAFVDNTNLVSVTIPDSVTILNVCCFGYCTNLKNVTLGNQVQEISGHAFCDTAIEQITLPDSVVHIGDNAFSGVPISEISIPPVVDSLSLRCFAETNLEHITVPGNVKTIRRIALKGNLSLKTVMIEEGVEKIEEDVFSGCNSLISIAIPASVTDLSEKVLNGCMPGTGKLKIYVVAGSVAESVINENYADQEHFEIVSLENMDNIESIMEADREAADNAAEVTQRYYVKLISAENDKVMVIKMYREYTGAGLSESKDKIDSAPCILIETSSEETAKELLEQLQQYDVVVDPDIYTETINGVE